MSMTNFVAANKSRSEVNNDMKEVDEVAATCAEEERENIENCDAAETLSSNSAKKNQLLVDAAAETDVIGHRETRQKHRRKSLVRCAARKKWTKTDAFTSAAAADDDDGDGDDDDDGGGGVTGDDIVGQTEQMGGTDVVLADSHTLDEDHHLLVQPPMSHKTVLISRNTVLPVACNILDIIDDMCPSTQRGAVNRTSNVASGDSRRATLLSNAGEHSRLNVEVQVDVMKLSSDAVDHGELDGSAVQEMPASLCQPLMEDRAPVVVYQPWSTDTAQNFVVRRRMGRTRLATPGRAGSAKQTTPRRIGVSKPRHTTPRRAGNARQTTLGRAGNTRQTTPGRVGNTRETTPGRVGNTRQTTAGCVGNPRQITPGCAGNPRETTPGRVGNTRQTTAGCVGNPRQITPGCAGNLRLTTLGHGGNTRQTTPGRVGNTRQTTAGRAGNPRQITPGRAGDKRRSAFQDYTRTPTATSAAITRPAGRSPAVSCSPALKRNAKGETALHTAAIKVISLHCIVVDELYF